ncbi:bacteriocin-like protein [Elizabethkingia meningoseptica]|uniref:bacteriocin-like protein n=1 Tax=Elizabethkingia meningoseptica TaxID=238 RepID=UPI00099ACC9F|nr:hypothetical protein [Elizabethkingia meningoseptica]MEC4711905.1 hypothetical protein [Elizabethkingia meningoseptica]OPB95106.1 hypothetical protein BAS10_12090 [Elizabethkingia meningoseptica]
MKNLKKLSRLQLKVISGGMVSCGANCAGGGGVAVDSCTSCISYPNGAACYNSHDHSIHVEKCLDLPIV